MYKYKAQRRSLDLLNRKMGKKTISAATFAGVLLCGIESTPLLNALKYGKGILCKGRLYFMHLRAIYNYAQGRILNTVTGGVLPFST